MKKPELTAAITLIDVAIAGAAPADYEESNYDAGFVAGLAAAKELVEALQPAPFSIDSYNRMRDHLGDDE